MRIYSSKLIRSFERQLIDVACISDFNSADLGCCHHLINHAALLSPNVFAASKPGGLRTTQIVLNAFASEKNVVQKLYNEKKVTERKAKIAVMR